MKHYKYLVFDTETSGINIGKDKPFMFQYGLVDDQLNLIETIVFYTTNTVQFDLFKEYLNDIPTIVGANIKFDMHMSCQAGIDPLVFKDKNYIDVMTLCRLIIDGDTQSQLNFKTSLKSMSMRYLGKTSNDEEQELKADLSAKTSKHKLMFRIELVKNGLISSTLSRTKITKIVDEIYNGWEKHYHKYPKVKPFRDKFFAKYPRPNYSDCDNIYTYGGKDIELTHGLFKLWYPQILVKEQTETLVRTSKAVYPLFLMERKGMTVDINKVLAARNKLLHELTQLHIIDPRTGAELTTGQYAKLKELYEYETGLKLAKSDKDTRAEIADKSPAARAVTTISLIEKYLSNYITNILKKLVYVDGEYRVYTQYNMSNTVTGRLSGDFQQFPKNPLTLTDGTVISVRDWFNMPKGDKYVFYFDYSQMELRLQCEWTNIINGEPDMNMARAFSPFKCTEDINGDFYYNEDLSIKWKPIDLHGLTTKHAFPGIDENSVDWKHYRAMGKKTNFAVNYGAGAARIQEMLGVPYQQAIALVDGYREAFKGVVDFGKWLKQRTYIAESTPNLLLRRYYTRNCHSLQNWLVQGSGADILLVKLHELSDYIADKPHWNFYITVHDEIGLTCKDIDNALLLKEVEDIKQLMTYELSAVDVISDVECTTTTWAEKYDWEGIVK